MITREQLIAAPDDDYMSPDQIAYFRALLLQQKAEIEQNLHQTHEDLASQERVADPTDRAALEEARLTMLRTRERETLLKHKIDAAIQRLDDGEFGYCVETGEPIGIQRLLIRPTTTLTVEAQIRKETHQRHYA